MGSAPMDIDDELRGIAQSSARQIKQKIPRLTRKVEELEEQKVNRTGFGGGSNS